MDRGVRTMSKSNLFGSITGLAAGLLLTFILVKLGFLTAIVHLIHVPLTWVSMVTGIIIASIVNAAVTHRLEK